MLHDTHQVSAVLRPCGGSRLAISHCPTFKNIGDKHGEKKPTRKRTKRIKKGKDGEQREEAHTKKRKKGDGAVALTAMNSKKRQTSKESSADNGSQGDRQRRQGNSTSDSPEENGEVVDGVEKMCDRGEGEEDDDDLIQQLRQGNQRGIGRGAGCGRGGCGRASGPGMVYTG